MTIDERYQVFTASVTNIVYQVQRIKDTALSPWHLKGRSSNCLFYLSRHPEGLTISELTVLCGEDKAAVSRCISELREQHYVTASSASGKKYRAKIRLTESGQAAALHLDKCIRSAVESGGATLSDADRAIFYRCLSDITHDLEAHYQTLT